MRGANHRSSNPRRETYSSSETTSRATTRKHHNTPPTSLSNMSLSSLISDLYSSLTVSNVHAEAPPAATPEAEEPVEGEKKEEPTAVAIAAVAVVAKEEEEKKEEEEEEEEEEEPEDPFPSLLQGRYSIQWLAGALIGSMC